MTDDQEQSPGLTTQELLEHLKKKAEEHREMYKEREERQSRVAWFYLGRLQAYQDAVHTASKVKDD